MSDVPQQPVERVREVVSRVIEALSLDASVEVVEIENTVSVTTMARA